MHPDDRHIVHETVQRVRQPGGTGRFDIEYRTIGIHDGKERWVAERGRAVLDSSGEVTRFIGTYSSSATNWVCTVEKPCPNSHFPE